MNPRLIVLTAILVVAGCASSSDAPSEPAGPCAEMRGAYVLSLKERPGGNCGPVPDLVIDVDPDKPDPNCTGTPTVSADRCKRHGTIQCGNVKSTFSCTVNKSATNATCVWTAEDIGKCLSTYDATYRKQ